VIWYPFDSALSHISVLIHLVLRYRGPLLMSYVWKWWHWM